MILSILADSGFLHEVSRSARVPVPSDAVQSIFKRLTPVVSGRSTYLLDRELAGSKPGFNSRAILLSEQVDSEISYSQVNITVMDDAIENAESPVIGVGEMAPTLGAVFSRFADRVIVQVRGNESRSLLSSLTLGLRAMVGGQRNGTLLSITFA